MRVVIPMLSKPFTAALVLSAAAHAAIAFTASDAASSNDHRAAALSRGRTLHAALAQRSTAIEPVSQQRTPSASIVPAIERIASASIVATAPRVRHQRDGRPEISEKAFLPSADDPPEPVVKPTPLTYPVFVLPPDDDPRRIGLVRLLLVVSSEGRVVNVIVAASTMSQDYIDRVTKSFEEMRFTPGRLRGAPHPGWYEVVVNFDFEPQAAESL